MKRILILLVLALSFSFSGCEKDDICDANTPTTPRLVISFYDFTSSTLLKNVSNLRVVAEGVTEPLLFNGSAVSNGSSISIPLKTDADTTTYTFTYNYGNPNPALVFVDQIVINYARNTLFVSRACGFKTVYTLSPTNPIIHTAVPSTNETWMRYISVKNSNIDNENETHLEIFF